MVTINTRDFSIHPYNNPLYGIGSLYYPLQREFTTFNSIRPGQTLNTIRTYTKKFYNALYAGQLYGLFTQEASDENGLSQINNIRDIMKINYFELIVDKHFDGIFSDRPIFEGKLSERQKDMLDNGLEVAVNEQAKRAVKWRLLNGTGVYAVRMGEAGPYPEAINPEHYFEARLNHYTNKVAAHLIAIPFESSPQNRVNNSTPVYDRVRIVYFDRDRGINAVRIFQYNHSGYIGGQIGPDQVSDFIDIRTFGTDIIDSVIPPLVDPVKTILIRHTHRNKILSQNASPYVVPPSGVSVNSASDQLKGRVLRRGTGGPNQSNDWEHFSANPDSLPYVENQIRELNEIILQLGKLPSGSINFDGLKGESGTSKQEQKTMLTTTERDIQNELIMILPDIYNSLGLGKVEMRFKADPYVSQKQREESLRADFQMGIISLEEIRNELGYGDVPEELMKEREAKMNSQNQQQEEENRGNN